MLQNLGKYRWMSVLVVGVLLLGIFAITRLGRITSTSSTPTAQVLATLSYASPIRSDIDFASIALAPGDMTDLFPGTSYSIQQANGSAIVRGLTVTYPTKVVEHISAFAEGFETRIQVFADATKASQFYQSSTTQQKGTRLETEKLGDASSAFTQKVTSPEGYEIGSTEYMLVFQKQNAVVMITIRTLAQVPSTRLTELANVVLRRLSP